MVRTKFTAHNKNMEYVVTEAQHRKYMVRYHIKMRWLRGEISDAVAARLLADAHLRDWSVTDTLDSPINGEQQ